MLSEEPVAARGVYCLMNLTVQIQTSTFPDWQQLHTPDHHDPGGASSWMNPADSCLLKHDLHRQGRALAAGDGIYFHKNKITHFMSLSLPCGRREKGTDNGNPWLLLVLSKTVQMMPCKLKKSGIEQSLFNLFPQKLPIIVHGTLSTQTHGKRESCHIEVTCFHFILVGVPPCIALVGTWADPPLSYNLSADYFLLFVIHAFNWDCAF